MIEVVEHFEGFDLLQFDFSRARTLPAGLADRLVRGLSENQAVRHANAAKQPAVIIQKRFIGSLRVRMERFQWTWNEGYFLRSIPFDQRFMNWLNSAIEPGRP